MAGNNHCKCISLFPFGIAELASDRSIIDADDEFCGLLDAQESELKGKRFDQFVSRTNRGHQQAYFRAVAETPSQTSRCLLVTIETLTGPTRLVELRLFKTDSGWIACIASDSRDLLHELVVDQSRWRAVLRSGELGLIVLDKDLHVKDTNLVALDALSCSSEHGVLLNGDAIRGQRLSKILNPAAFKPVFAALAARNPRKRKYAGIIHHADKTLAINVAPLLLPGTEGLEYCIIIRDKTAEEDAASMRADLSRVAGMAEIATGVLHNVGNVMNSLSVSSGKLHEALESRHADDLRLAIQLLQQSRPQMTAFFADGGKGKKLISFLDSLANRMESNQDEIQAASRRIQESSDHAKVLIANQQELARGASCAEQCGVDVVLRQALDLVTHAYGKSKVALDYDIVDCPKVSVGRHEVLQVLVNLLTNARQAVEANDGDARQVTLSLRKDDTRVYVDVTDSGVGIAAEQQAKVFRHGFTTKAGGHGFGLHNSANIAQRIGAELTFASDGKGRGSTFTFAIPLAGVRSTDERKPQRGSAKPQAVDPAVMAREPRGLEDITATLGLDVEGNISTWDAAARDLFGYESDEVAGRHLSTLMDVATDVVTAELQRAMDCECLPQRRSLWRKNSGQEVAVEYLLSAVYFDDQLDGYRLIVKPASSVVIADAPSERFTDTADGRWMARLSHEIRTPMTAIVGMSAILRDEQLSEDQVEQVEAIYNASNTLMSLLNNVLDLSRIQSQNLRLEQHNIVVARWLDHAMSIFRAQAIRKNVQLTCAILNNDNKTIVGDPTRLHQILINLVSNALKFTREGSVDVEVTVEAPVDKPAVLELVVRDTGCGIPQDKLQSIFAEFQQANLETSMESTGAGLGLAICCELVRFMRGNISVSSTVGKGTEFVVRVPVKCVSAAEAPAPPPQERPQSDRSLRILVAEDNGINQKVVKRLLEKLGHQVVVVDDGREAVAAILDDHFDVVLMDCNMPIMDGYEATSQIRQLSNMRSVVPIVAMTANALPANRDKCLRAGMNSYLAKPVSLDVLARELAEVVS